MKFFKSMLFLLFALAGAAHASPDGPRFTFISYTSDGHVFWWAPSPVVCNTCLFEAPTPDAATRSGINGLRRILKFSPTGRINEVFYPAVGDVINFCDWDFCRNYKILGNGNYQSVGALMPAPEEFKGFWPDPQPQPPGGTDPPDPSPPTCTGTHLHGCDVP